MKLKCLITITSMILMTSCKSVENQLKCLDKYANDISQTPNYNLVLSAAKDTVTQWAKMKLKFYDHLPNQVDWRIDSAIFFNEDHSKALLLLLKVYTIPDAKMDFVSVIAAEKKEDEWHFYTQSMPNMSFPRDLNQNKPYTFEKLSEIAREELILGGFYEEGTCSINYDYINKWFNQPLAEYHQNFLRNKVQ